MMKITFDMLWNGLVGLVIFFLLIRLMIVNHRFKILLERQCQLMDLLDGFGKNFDLLVKTLRGEK